MVDTVGELNETSHDALHFSWLAGYSPINTKTIRTVTLGDVLMQDDEHGQFNPTLTPTKSSLR